MAPRPLDRAKHPEPQTSNSRRQSPFVQRHPYLTATLGVGSLAAIGLGAWLATRYHVCHPTEYLVRTGFMIPDMTISKRGMQFPFQKATYINLQPSNHSFKLACLSKQYLPFDMPVTYTLKPVDPADNLDAFKKYCRQMADMEHEEFSSTILGVIHGETRVLAANMDIDAINDDRDKFREQVVERVENILQSMGLKVVNANIAELSERQRESGQMGYLQARERKKLASAVQQSEIDVAQATQEGDVGKKHREAMTRQETSRLEAETVAIENSQREAVLISQAKLGETNAEAERRKNVAQIEAQANADTLEQELQMKVEEARKRQNSMHLQADILVQSQVEAESKIARAAGDQESAVRKATGDADAIRLVAQAKADEKQMMLEAEAEGRWKLLEAEAKGELEMLKARAEGTKEFVQACDGDPNLIREVLWVQNEIPQAIAKSGADAVQGMKPQIWSMAKGDDVGTSVANLFAGLTPGLEMLRKQGVIAPSDKEAKD